MPLPPPPPQLFPSLPSWAGLSCDIHQLKNRSFFEFDAFGLMEVEELLVFV